jgi:hypothetical protein
MPMKSWVHADNNATQSKFTYSLVFSREQAAEMTEHDAHEVMRAAETGSPEYVWEMVRVSDARNLFVVEGTEK